MRELVVMTGMSGSGKSVALSALEDAGFYCIDNLPPELLLASLALERNQRITRLAIAIDARNAASLPLVPHILESVKQQGVNVRVVFLDASTDALVRRFSETRRKHPLAAGEDAHGDDALVQMILRERHLMGTLRDMAFVIDSSHTRVAQLQASLKQFLGVERGHLTLVFQSFSYKRGVPRDADYVFDVRMLPNPHYEPKLKALTGMDQDVITFFEGQPLLLEMENDIAHFLKKWLPYHVENHRSYVSVAIGCTGGQHRSVYLVERLTQAFASEWATLKRHREIALRQAG